MALIKCAKCGQPVSPHANTCPCCEYSPRYSQCADCIYLEEGEYTFECRYCNKTGSDSACPGYVSIGNDDDDDYDDDWDFYL